MHTHIHDPRGKLELATFLVGLPIAVFVASLILWWRLRHDIDASSFRARRYGFQVIAKSFATYLAALWLMSLSGHGPDFREMLVVLLSLGGAVAAYSGLVLAILNTRGWLRVSGALLGLLALGYAVLSGLALLRGAHPLG